MPLNKLDNFIKNTEGRILYVSPADLDSTDSIDNQGNSLARPFKTIQRALLESARFSYLEGNNNDEVEKTTILLMPGEHIVDNRPGYKATNDGSAAQGSSSITSWDSSNPFDLNLNSNFDLSQESNILARFNSVHGGVIVPRGTSIVGLDLRKTKIRPKYVPNPTDSSVKNSAIFRITGTCYFWQFSIFDGDDTGVVYTDPSDFSINNRSVPLFSHHKLTCFEYADGVNNVEGYSTTDLDMYYKKLSRAYNAATSRAIDITDGDIAKVRPEYEIVGAFGDDSITITDVVSGDGITASNVVTVTTNVDHNLNVGTPIKIRGVGTSEYNISTKVASVASTRKFTYRLSSFPVDLNANPSLSNANVTIETDTVSGASPYIFNISMRSVYGMNGMHADGSKATGFRSMVVAQFTGISLQKDDRAFVKYSPTSRVYEGIGLSVQRGTSLSLNSSSTNPNTVYHLDSGAVYRSGWEQTHIKISNKAILQIVSVFAIGFNKHFFADTGGDASITNSNSNFGQLSLISTGFRPDAFDKDNKAHITNIIPPRAITSVEEDVDWFTIDTSKTATSTRLYLTGFDTEDSPPPSLTQGYNVGARLNDKLYVNINNTTYSADIHMDVPNNSTISAVKDVQISGQPSNNVFTTSSDHNFSTGEKVILISDTGDLPENIEPDRVYYIITGIDGLGTDKFKLASSKTNADNYSVDDRDNAIDVYKGTNLRVLSRVSDKESGDVGHPVQWDTNEGNWYITVDSSNTIHSQLSTLNGDGFTQTEASYIKRTPDTRSLDEKLYKLRVVVPKQIVGGKTPEAGFIIQESSTTGIRTTSDFNLASDLNDQNLNGDYDYNRNPRFIATCSVSSNVVTVLSEIPHNLQSGDKVTIIGVKDSTANTVGAANSGFNGTFLVSNIVDDMSFKYSTTDVDGVVHSGIGNITNDVYTTDRTVTEPPRFRRDDLQNNFYIYRNEVISEYIQDKQDGVYHLYALSADYAIPEEFTDLKYSQNVKDLYPQLDRDNKNDNPPSATTFALRSPLGKVDTNTQKNSITRETIDKLTKTIGIGAEVSSANAVTGGTEVTFSRRHGIGGIAIGDITAGSGYNTGTYYNVKLFDTGTSNWRGATAKVVVDSGNITSVEIMSPGSGYSGTHTLDFDTSVIGSGSNGALTVQSTYVLNGVGDVIQFTGIATATDSIRRITSVDSDTQITVGSTSGDSTIYPNQYAILTGPSVQISSTHFEGSATGISSFTCSSAHGLQSGNKIRILDVDSNNLGDFLVTSVPEGSPLKFKTKTGSTIGGYYVLKHGYSSNDGVSDITNENISKRGYALYDNTSATAELITNEIQLTPSNSGVGTESRFPIGSYFQVGDEIVRVAGYDGNGNVRPLRGVFATKKSSIPTGSLARKIKPIPVEFRRPSILRASGHTFEYLGYGPGNYSTGLPQVQDRTLTEHEELLSQSQERSGGIVAYTGMNNRGDFYIGNTKKSSATGEESTFDTPIPTITGENPSRLSAVFDEVSIKERLVVEGGDSGLILSQFDGPVTFTKTLRIKDTSNFSANVKIVDETSSTSTSTGALIVSGGVGIGATLNSDTIISKNVKIGDSDNTINTTSGDLIVTAISGSKVAINTDTDIDGALTVTGDITAFYVSSDERLKDNITPIEDPLAKVISISGNTFEWKELDNYQGEDTGVIAQEVEALGLPGIVKNNSNGYKSVQYHKLVPLLIEAVKELSAKVDSLEQRLNN